MKKNILSLITAATLAISGCKINTPLSDDLKYKQRDGVYSGANFRGAYKLTYYDVDLKESKTVPVHKDDSFSGPGTQVKADGGLDILAGSVGIEGLIGNKESAFVGGIDLDLDFSKFLGDIATNDAGKRSYLYDFKQQNGDSRPASSGSFAYDKINPPLVSPVPFIGVRSKFDKLTFNAELGFAYKRFEREWGHHRYRKEDQIGSDADSAFSLRPAIGLSYKAERDSSIGLEISRESYKLDYGRIKSLSLMLTFIKDF